MVTPHYVMSSGRMTDERRRDNDSVVRFDASPGEMRALLREYGVAHVVVRTDVLANELRNGDFSITVSGTVTGPPSNWSAVVSSSIAGIADGVSGPGLELSPSQSGYPSQFAYQNVSVRAGATYRLDGHVKSGTSGDEPFAIEVFDHNVGTKQLAIDGVTIDSQVDHSMSFIAPERQLSVVLHKNSPASGTMLFDEVSLAEVGAAIVRVRGQSDMFTEVITSPEYVVFEVTRAATLTFCC